MNLGGNENYGQTQKDNFSKSIFATHFVDEGNGNTYVTADNIHKVMPNIKYCIFGGDSDGSAVDSIGKGQPITDMDVFSSALPEFDSQIRQLATLAVEYKDDDRNLDLWFRLAHFPTDEEAIAAVRREYGNPADDKDSPYVVGTEVLKWGEITPDKFTIRWNVFKRNPNTRDWHIDGVLTRKKGKLVVTKIFAGEELAIQAVKNNGYSIKVVPDDPQLDTVEHTLNLEPVTEDNPGGYSSYDSDTGKYTWVIDVQPTTTYSVTEENYIYTGTENGVVYSTSAEYQIQNGKTGNCTWKKYDPDTGIQNLSVEAYPEDILDNQVFQRVEFRNTYKKTYTLSLEKVDYTTGHGLPGIRFNIEKFQVLTEDGKYVDCKDRICLADGFTSGVYQIHTPGSDVQTVLETGKDGILWLNYLETGTYEFTLEEEAPPGYDASGDYGQVSGRVTVLNGQITDTVISKNDAGVRLNGRLDYGEDDVTTWRLKNKSVDKLVSVTKDWLTDSEQTSVSIQLLRNGVAVDTVMLDGTGNYVQTNEEAVLGWSSKKVAGWTCTWTVPKMVDLKKAVYTVKETRIGTVDYDTMYPDGYADYIVLTSKGTTVTDGEGQEHLSYVVSNMLDHGQILIYKYDENNNPLPGAEFTFYTDEACTQPVMTAAGTSLTCTSNDKGIIFIRNSLLNQGGTYYMKETKFPDSRFYELNDSVYKINIKNKVSTVTVYNEDAHAWVTADGIVDASVQVTEKILTVKKQVKGNLADTDKRFDFTLRVKDSRENAYADDLTVSYGEDGEQVLHAKGDGSYHFRLKHGEHINIAVPENSVCSVSEEESVSAGYAVSYQVDDEPVVKGDSWTGGKMTRNTVVTFINVLDAVAYTGVKRNILPYVLLAAVGALLLVGMGYFHSRKRRHRES